MRRADRLFQIIQYLQGRRLVTAKQLAERLEVSERTVYRDVQDLMLSGVPIEGEAGVGYMLRAGFHLPPLMFSPEEMEALVTGARLVKSWGGNKLAESAEQALAKIDRVLPPKLRQEIGDTRLFAPGFHAYARHTAQLDGLRGAINARRVLKIGYIKEDGTTSEREIRPLGLFFWGAVWTLAAWCEMRKDYRSFRIDRIQQITDTERRFEETKEISLEALFAKYRAAETGN
ncbi:MAG TPA: YafY family protein [Gammaproteobacteria bacterium]|jgi:predicted DNA-binding transcriptional regulator YafY|nr:YafY family protein [Gammaproteobacteria bacterium]